LDKFIGRKDSVLETEVGFEEQGGRIKNEKLRMKNYELRVIGAWTASLMEHGPLRLIEHGPPSLMEHGPSASAD